MVSCTRLVALLVAQPALVAFAHPAPVAAAPPAEFTANPAIGNGSGSFKDSAHFRAYGVDSSSVAKTLQVMEAAYQCFVDQFGWRSPGLSWKGSNDGPYYKMNIYQAKESDMPGAAAQTWTDTGAGFPYLKVVAKYVTDPSVIVHEFGHAMTYSEKNWIDQGRTGAWWETYANFVADQYIATPLCATVKRAANLPDGDSLIDVKKVIGDSFQVIVDGTSSTGNYYQAWPFLSYITTNPDKYSGLGSTVILDMIRKYKINSNDTPLHSLANLLGGDVTIQKLVGRYWARMAFVDIGHPKALQKFTSQRSSIKYANLDSGSSGKYTVKSARAPRYMGANIIPLKMTGSSLSVVINASASSYTATLAIKDSSGNVRYVDILNGNATEPIASGEEAMLVVANTPALAEYDAFKIPADLNKGLTYSVQLTGATA